MQFEESAWQALSDVLGSVLADVASSRAAETGGDPAQQD